jgi:hypothetical protein
MRMGNTLIKEPYVTKLINYRYESIDQSPKGFFFNVHSNRVFHTNTDGNNI